MRDLFSVPSLATINASAAAYIAASVFCRKRWGLNIYKTIEQAQHWVCWEAGHDNEVFDESSNGGNGNLHGLGRDQVSTL